ncbi:outer membrane lipoprotein carrier protein [Parabacteroides sp. PFB2-12]|uniref:LolA family protein n=1 Tax=unclassified Parabacteroides TaxID=2649774 RepID=UPI0024746DAB|nr:MULTISPECIES: outer membrane lipoprotein carrier protein LolA [unclassified Parabacteroides]MDH6344108.1 outer membrane lipoprotein carrier protein [Parabacteroides sp. PM6-13]MDH6391555.1 outer membrane lipoprotein carrier protein [Parabacteroides sp. PFB2-12]
MKKILISLTLMFATATAFAQNGTAILDKIKEANKSLTTITSDFKQTMHLTFMDEDVLSNGKFYYRKPDRLLLKYSQPEGEMMLIKGDEITMVMMDQHTKVSAKSDPAIELIHTIFSSCLEGDARKIKDATVDAVEKADYYEVIITIKGDRAQNMKGVKVHYDKKEMALSLLRTEDPDGGYTVYELVGKKLNQPIAEEVFQ